MTNRVISYIDGFNLYYGLKEMGWRRYYWLNLAELVGNLLKPGQELIRVKYFTARISAKDKDTCSHLKNIMEAKRKRQAVYLEALSTLDDLVIYEGHYLSNIIKCRNCGHFWQSPEEKMTDVNIATEILSDAFDDHFDTAILISGDSDLVPPIQSLRQRYPLKRVVVAFPPHRVTQRLKKAASAYFVIDEIKFRKSLFPNEVAKPDGYILKRPEEWK